MTNVRQVLERLSNAKDRSQFEKVLNAYDMTFRRIDDRQMIESIDRIRQIVMVARFRKNGVSAKTMRRNF